MQVRFLPGLLPKSADSGFFSFEIECVFDGMQALHMNCSELKLRPELNFFSVVFCEILPSVLLIHPATEIRWDSRMKEVHFQRGLAPGGGGACRSSCRIHSAKRLPEHPVPPKPFGGRRPNPPSHVLSNFGCGVISPAHYGIARRSITFDGLKTIKNESGTSTLYLAQLLPQVHRTSA